MMKHQQQGFTLIELALASALSIVVILMITQAFQANQRATAYQTNMSRMQENARFAALFLSRHIGAADGTVDGTDSGVNVTDEVSTIYQASQTESTCANNSETAGNNVESRFNIGVGVSGTPSLFCDDGSSNQEIVPDIEHLRVVFGEDTDADGSINTWVDKGDVSDLNNVLAVQVALLVRSEDPIRRDESSKTYTLIDTNVTKTDQFLRDVYSFTIALGKRL